MIVVAEFELEQVTAIELLELPDVGEQDGAAA